MSNLAQSFFEHSKAVPAGPALVIDEQSYCYRDLADIAGRIATWLNHRATKADRPVRVGILAARSLPAYAGILAASWAGAAYVPLNPRGPAVRLSAIIKRAGIDAMIADHVGEAFLPQLPLAGMPILSPANWRDLDSLPAAAPAQVGPHAPAYILFTSGTTGAPKGVIVSTDAVNHLLGCVRDRYRLRPDDRVGQFAQATFDASVLEIFSAWSAGASVHVVPEHQLLMPVGFIRRHELTTWCSVPALIGVLGKLNQLQPGSLPSLRISIFGGEAFSVSAAKAWQLAAPSSMIDNQYGPTEAAVACTAQEFTHPPIQTPGRDTLAIGTPLPGNLVDIVDGAGRFLPPGQPGELAIAGPQLATGYLGDHELTARRFPTLAHPRHGAMRWYLTGDQGLRDAAGRLHHLGRIDNQIKIMGHRIELEEIDAHLRAVCGAEHAAAIAWPIVSGNATGLTAFVAGGDDLAVRLPAEVVREQLAARLPPYMIPRGLRFISSMPLSANGKIDRKALASLLEDPKEAGDE